MGGIPSVKLIGTTIEKAKQITAKQAGIVHNQKGGYKGIFAIVPSIGVILIPGISCPACWPAYAGLLIIASIWNLWPGKNKGNISCSFCVPAGDIAKDK